MKTRNDFVSNSSSSSFIVIANSGSKSERLTNFDSNKTMYIPNRSNGCTEFGWEETEYRTFEDKLNFIGLQLLYLAEIRFNIIFSRGLKKKVPYIPHNIDENTFEKYYKMVQKVCAEKFNIKIELDDVLKYRIYLSGNDYVRIDSYDMYIDHQSAATEGRCLEMFKDEETLYNFLEFNNSYIQGGNDNH